MDALIALAKSSSNSEETLPYMEIGVVPQKQPKLASPKACPRAEHIEWFPHSVYECGHVCTTPSKLSMLRVRGVNTA